MYFLLFQNLQELEIEDEKRNLIHREIDRFRDTYKVLLFDFYFDVLHFLFLFRNTTKKKKKKRKNVMMTDQEEGTMIEGLNVQVIATVIGETTRTENGNVIFGVHHLPKHLIVQSHLMMKKMLLRSVEKIKSREKRR